MRPRALIAAAVVASLAVTACRGDTAAPSPTTSLPGTVPPPASSAPDSSAPGSSAPGSTAPGSTVAPSSTGTAASTSTSAPGPCTPGADGLEQPAVWPAAETVLPSPEAAAADFVAAVLGVPVRLGPFLAGDSRSGEIEVLSPGEGGGTPVARAVLFVRRLGSADGWFVLGAASAGATIDQPAALAEVEPGPLEVVGRVRGFEASATVTAFLAGDAAAVLDAQQVFGGSLETPEEFRATLDLGAAPPGGTVAVIIRGGVGLETDPGEFAVIPIRIAIPGCPDTGA